MNIDILTWHINYKERKSNANQRLIYQKSEITFENNIKILVTVTQSATDVPQTNNISTSGMNEEQCENIARNNQSQVFDCIMSIVSCLNFDCIMSIVSCLNFAQIGGFLYFAGYFGFKMAAIANQNGRNMVQLVLLPVNIHFH